MDMACTIQPTIQPKALRRLLDQVLSGADVIVFTEGDNGRLLLDLAADRLVEQHGRALRVAGILPGGLSLPMLIAQVAKKPYLNAQNDELLKQGFQALTVLDETCNRIVLLVSDAHALQKSAFRYIQLVCRSTANLQLVFAGRHGFLDLLNADEFAYLRARLVASLNTTLPVVVSAPSSNAPPTPLSVRDASAIELPRTARSSANLRGPAIFASLPDRSRRRIALAGIGLGMAAFVTLGIWIGWPAAVSQQAVLVAQPLTAPEVSAAAAVGTQPMARAGSGNTLDTTPAISEAPYLQLPAVTNGAPAPAPPPGMAPAPIPKSLPGSVATGWAETRAALPVAKQGETRPNDLLPGSLQGAGRRSPGAQAQAATAASAIHARDSGEREHPYARPHDERPLPLPQADYQATDHPQSYVGTYTTGVNGVRMFRLGP